MKNLLGWLLLVCVLAACGGPSEGPPLGAFPAIAKKETDPPFAITPPSSRSPAPFSFTSSNTAVAVINGANVTIIGPGQTTITASQASVGSFGPTHASTTLTVEAVACDAGNVRVNGKCTPIPTCIAPAVLSNNQCVAPASTASTVVAVNLSWMGATNVVTFDNASKFCTGSVIDGSSGWRLPTAEELGELYDSGAVAGHGWLLGNTWSSTMGADGQSAGHTAVNLATGAKSERADTLGAYVTCVR